MAPVLGLSKGFLGSVAWFDAQPQAHEAPTSFSLGRVVEGAPVVQSRVVVREEHVSRIEGEFGVVGRVIQGPVQSVECLALPVAQGLTAAVVAQLDVWAVVPDADTVAGFGEDHP